MNCWGYAFRGLLVVLFLNGPLLSWADSNDNNNNDKNKNSKTSNALVEQHVFVTGYLESLRDLKTSFDLGPLEEALKMVREFPTIQAREILTERFERMPSVAKVIDIPDLSRAIRVLLETYREVGGKQNVEMLQDFKNWVALDVQDSRTEAKVNETIRHLRSQKAEERILYDIFETNKEFIENNIPKELLAEIAADKLKDKKAEAHKSALADVERFYQFLKKQVVGQEHILRGLRTLYLQDLLIAGNRTAPEVFYLLGLPGNGKDTIAEAYVDALYNQKGAHKDHLFAMNIRSKSEAWSYFGSGKGYVGSGELPAFLAFLVRHSGGKYVLGEQVDGSTKRKVVELNPEWKPNISEGSGLGPHRAVVFVNEAHNIPKEVKDNVLKQAIERGIFPITNPGGTPNSVERIELPITFIFASNEGIELLEPRNRNGSRVGAPLSYDRLLENYELVAEDKAALKQSILKTNGGENDTLRPDAPGTSEEFLNRIPNHRLLMLQPFSTEELVEVGRRIADQKIAELKNASGSLGNYEINVSDNVLRFIADYRAIPSENARPIKGRINDYVFNSIYEAIELEKVRPLGRTQTIDVDLKSYKNGSVTTIFKVTDNKTGETYQFTRLIRETLQDIPQAPLSEQRINELLTMRETMVSNVFGVEHIVDRLLEAAIVSESVSKNSGESSRPATVMAFLGKSSTGKTETAKQYVKARYGESAQPTIIDFNSVRTVEAMEAKIMGSYDGNKNPIPSAFMKAYDRANGEITFIFDEAANAPKDLLKALYEVTREANPAGFSDGKVRPMKNVTIILTGNAGEQIYESLPEGLPKNIRERAMNEVFKIFIQNEDLRHRVMLQTFPEALLARLGQNVFHFGPLQDDGKRQVAQLKLEKGLKSLEPTPSERGWKVGFMKPADLFNLFEMIELQGFKLEEQGASIDKFVRESVIDKIKSRLLLEKVPSGENVYIEVNGETTVKNDRGTRYISREITVHTPDTKFQMEIPLGVDQPVPGKDSADRVLTAYHEAGHEIVSNVFFGDRQRAVYLSIIEGVALIGKSLVPYNGVREGEMEIQSRMNKQVVLRDAAILAAGYVAQQMITLGGRDDGGKSNDMLRATGLIQNAILRYGLSDRWGVRAIQEGVSIQDYIASELSASEKEYLHELTNDWLKEAETLAREAIWANMDSLFVNMSKAIAREGHLYADQINELYDRYGVITEREGKSYEQIIADTYEVVDLVDKAVEKAAKQFHTRFTENDFDWSRAEEAFRFLEKRSAGLTQRFNPMRKSLWDSMDSRLRMVAGSRIGYHIKYKSRDAQIASEELMPERIANIDEIIRTERLEKTDKVTDVERFEIMDKRETESPKVSVGSRLRCTQLFQ